MLNSGTYFRQGEDRMDSFSFATNVVWYHIIDIKNALNIMFGK